MVYKILQVTGTLAVALIKRLRYMYSLPRDLHHWIFANLIVIPPPPPPPPPPSSNWLARQEYAIPSLQICSRHSRNIQFHRHILASSYEDRLKAF
jgi:hypothetical protein